MTDTIDIAGAAAVLRCSEEHVKRMARRGEIPGARLGRWPRRGYAPAMNCMSMTELQVDFWSFVGMVVISAPGIIAGMAVFHWIASWGEVRYIGRESENKRTLVEMVGFVAGVIAYVIILTYMAETSLYQHFLCQR